MDNATYPVMDRIAKYVRRFSTPEDVALLSLECSIDIWMPMAAVNAQVGQVQRLIPDQIDADLASADWITRFRAAGVDAGVWTPADWPDRIKAEVAPVRQLEGRNRCVY